MRKTLTSYNENQSNDDFGSAVKVNIFHHGTARTLSIVNIRTPDCNYMNFTSLERKKKVWISPV